MARPTTSLRALAVVALLAACVAARRAPIAPSLAARHDVRVPLPATTPPATRPFTVTGAAPPRASCLSLRVRAPRALSALDGRARLRWPFATLPRVTRDAPRTERLLVDTPGGELSLTLTETLRRDASTLRDALDRLSVDGASPRAWVTPHGLRAIAFTAVTGRVVDRPRTVYRAWVALPDDLVLSIEARVDPRSAPDNGACAWVAHDLVDAIEAGDAAIDLGVRRVDLRGAGSIDVPEGWATTVTAECVSTRYAFERVTSLLGPTARATVIVSHEAAADPPASPWITLDEANDRVHVGLPTRAWSEAMLGRRVTWREESLDDTTLRRRASLTSTVRIAYESDDREGLTMAEAVVRSIRLTAVR